jgi:hypothetical protein
MPIGLDSPPDIKFYDLNALFPGKGTVAQVPYLYGEEHNKLLNEIMRCEERKEDDYGNIFYSVTKVKDRQMEKANKLLDYLDEIHELAEQLGLRPSEVLL